MANLEELLELNQPEENTISAADMLADMMNLTNLCVAGTTGSGKSVLLRNFIHEAVKDSNNLFALIDLKSGATLYPYKDLPQTLFYAEYNGGDSLYKVYDVLAKVERIRQTRIEKMKTEDATFPTVFLIIDEFPKLTRISERKLKKAIMDVFMDILAMGRESNIFPVIATQEVTKEILGSVKSVVNSWVALICANAQESRNILGHSGAEKLPRFGQCIYKPTQRDEDERHCLEIPLCTKQDAKELVARLKAEDDADVEIEAEPEEIPFSPEDDTMEQVQFSDQTEPDEPDDLTTQVERFAAMVDELCAANAELVQPAYQPEPEAKEPDPNTALLQAILSELQQQNASRAEDSARMAALEKDIMDIKNEQQRAREAAQMCKRKSSLAWLKEKAQGFLTFDRVATTTMYMIAVLAALIAFVFFVSHPVIFLVSAVVSVIVIQTAQFIKHIIVWGWRY